MRTAAAILLFLLVLGLAAVFAFAPEAIERRNLLKLWRARACPLAA